MRAVTGAWRFGRAMELCPLVSALLVWPLAVLSTPRCMRGLAQTTMFIRDKIFFHPKDEVALVLFGSQETVSCLAQSSDVGKRASRGWTLGAGHIEWIASS